MLSNAYSKICFFDHHFSSFFLQTLNANLQQNIVIFHTFPTIPNMLKLICLLNSMCTLFEIHFKSKKKNFIQYLKLPIFTLFYWNKSCTLTSPLSLLSFTSIHAHSFQFLWTAFPGLPSLPFKPSFPFFPSNPSFPSDPFFPFNPSLPSRPSRPSLHFRSFSKL